MGALGTAAHREQEVSATTGAALAQGQVTTKRGMPWRSQNEQRNGPHQPAIPAPRQMAPPQDVAQDEGWLLYKYPAYHLAACVKP